MKQNPHRSELMTCTDWRDNRNTTILLYLYNNHATTIAKKKKNIRGKKVGNFVLITHQFGLLYTLCCVHFLSKRHEIPSMNGYERGGKRNIATKLHFEVSNEIQTKQLNRVLPQTECELNCDKVEKVLIKKSPLELLEKCQFAN